MCYDVTSGLKALIKYARHRNDHPDYIAALEKKLEEWKRQADPHHHVSGFQHPKLLVFTNTRPQEPQAYTWGLIPSWTKDEESARSICNQTLNARSESMFEKSAFRNASKNKRCLVYVDAFFEHHHFGKKTYPFQITSIDDAPLALAGLWDEWIHKETGEVLYTVSIVTCRAEGKMARIHNNPKLPEPRMPVILPKEKQDEWLEVCKTKEDQENLLKLCKPYPENLLRFHTVRPLRGKQYPGDTAEAEAYFEYPELHMEFGN
ncbi:MAG TPA: SOS response-associated peptidase [Bacteroidia bacterium]|nr:SOS response-associated peptidase [Bacteroidia bacterium]